MQTTIKLSQGEIAEIIAAALASNRLHAKDIAFDISTGELWAHVEVESEPLQVRSKPEPEDYTSQLLERMRRGRATGYG